MHFSEGEASFAVQLRGSECVIDCNAASKDPLRRLFAALRGGLRADHLAPEYGDFADEAAAVIVQLDRFGYLTDIEPCAPPSVIDAEAFALALARTIDADRQSQACGFTRALLDGSATRAQLIQYVIEYFHIVRHAPGLVAPVMNYPWEPGLRSQLSDFLASEWRHDRLIAQSLKAVSIEPGALRPSSILAPTFALLSQLGVRAATNPLALAALLFLFERPNPVFHEAFAANCKRLGLPGDFLAPIVRHASMNDGERHDEIANALIQALCPVSREYAVGALSDVVVAVEHLARLDAALAAAR
ncbi:MAG: hypothetical protein ACJ8LG_20420 [Massilia sp.]